MTEAFPTIDATPLLDPTSSSAQRTKTARQIDAACTTIGFFAVTGHGVSDQVIADLYTASYAFFDLPAEQKLHVRRPRPEQNRGYIPPGDETLARLAGRETPPDRKELFAVGPFDLPDEPYFTGPAAYPNLAPNLWPDRPATLRPAMQAYWRALERLARALCAGYATALGVPRDYFAASIDRHASQLRLMHYPAPSEPPLPGQLRAGEHTDLGMMTLLYSDNAVGGLQVKRRDGRWVDAPVTPGSFVVNLGDMMMRWTNDRWVSTPHRVVNPPPGAEALSRRLSVGMFFIPNYDAKIACIETCRVSGEPPRYAPISVAAYRTARFARTAGAAAAA
jgi:isopenicillin N synthase-like dioxygenase